MTKVQEEQAQGVWNVTEFKTTEKTCSEAHYGSVSSQRADLARHEQQEYMAKASMKNRAFKIATRLVNLAFPKFPKKQKMFTDEDIVAMHELLQWTYQLPEVRIMMPSVSKVLATDGLDTEEGQMAVLQAQENMKQCRWFAVPVHSSEPLHWTCVLFKMDPVQLGEVAEVRYYDWSGRVSSNARAATRLVACLTSNIRLRQLPATTNSFRQVPSSNDCGLAIWHALEQCMKEQKGEGQHTLYPTPVAWRQRLAAFIEVLEKEQDLWGMEVLASEVHGTAEEGLSGEAAEAIAAEVAAMPAEEEAASTSNTEVEGC